MKQWIKRSMIALTIPSLLLVTACGGQSKDGQAAGGQAEGKVRILKSGIGFNEDHSQAQGLKKFAEIVEKNSSGRIKVQNYFSSQLGDDVKMMEALKAGTQELTMPSTSPISNMVKEFGVFDFPFVFNNEQEAYAVLDSPFGQKLLDKLPQHGLIGLGYWENGYRNLTNSKRPVATVEDFKGLKIRTLQNKVHLEVFGALGANPVPMPFSEVFTGLESKTVDGQENPVAAIESSKFYEVQKYLSLTNHVYTPFVFLMSKKIWDQLTPEDQKMLKDAAAEAGKYQRELNIEQNKKSLESLKAKGMQVNELAPGEKEKIQQIVKPIVDKFAKDLGEDVVKELYDGVEKVRNK